MLFDSFVSLGLLTLSTVCPVHAELRRRSHLNVRQQTNATSSTTLDLLSASTYNASLYQINANVTAPGYRPGDADGQYVYGVDASNGADDNSQSPQCSAAIFIGTSDVQGGYEQGWTQLPQVLGFDLKRDLTFYNNISLVNSTMPYYIEANKDASKIKRAIIVQPGKPRDSWHYSNLMRNALICAAVNNTGVDLGTILIAAPAWTALVDKAAGATLDSDLAWNGSTWAIGVRSDSPPNANVSTFEVLDAMVERFFDKTQYPALNTVMVAGHSLGASLAQRYAALRKPTADEPNMHFWTGNLGSYVWPTSSRPFMNDSCTGNYDIWTYGLNATNPLTIPVYRRDDVVNQKDVVIQQWLDRHVTTALGTSDFGPGDTHCQAAWQGSSHFQRGQEYIWALGNLTGGMPTNQQVSYVANVSHQDYLMFSAPASLEQLFIDGIDIRAAQNLSYPQATSNSNAGQAKVQDGGGNGANGTSSSAPLSSPPIFTAAALLISLPLALLALL